MSARGHTAVRYKPRTGADDRECTPGRDGHRRPLRAPELPWEGANLPLEPSVRGWVDELVRQLRDPAIFREDERAYLLHALVIARRAPAGCPLAQPAHGSHATNIFPKRSVVLGLPGML
jgi:hypothetical protein